MALFEIEDQYAGQLQSLGVPVADRTADFKRAREHEQFIANVSKDPQHRNKLLELLADTGTYVPEVARVREVREEFNGLLADRLKPLDEFLERQKQREETEKTNSVQQLVNQGRNYLRQQGWDDQGVEEVETFMRNHSVGDYEVASSHLKSQRPSPDPLPTTSWNGSDLGNSWFAPPEDDKDHTLLLKNPQAFSQQQIAKFFREKREGRLKI